MQLTSSPRRALGLLAVGTIGMSGAVLGITGVASAEPSSPAPLSFTTGDDPDGDYDHANATALEIPEGYCSVQWAVYGGGGGAGGTNGSGGDAGTIGVLTTVAAGQTYNLYAGTAGGDATQSDPDQDVLGAAGAGGTNGKGGNGTAGTLDDDGFGGGGGAASEVYLGGVRQISAFGGNGGGAGGGTGAGGGVNYALAAVETDWAWDETSSSGDGSIDGSIMPCEVPDEEEVVVTGGPVVNWVDGVKNGLEFQLTISTVADDNPVKGVQFSLDGGAWTDVASENAGDYQYSGIIPGLQTGKTYQVSFRFTTAQGHSEASAPRAGSPALPGARSVTAVAGASQIKVSWTAPENMAGVAGYRVVGGPKGAQSSAGLVTCQPTEALGTSCVIGAKPGVVYTVLVESLDASGKRIAGSDWVDSQAVPAAAISSSLPKADGTMTSSDADGKVTAGTPITISGTGFLAGSTVELIVYSTPVKLGEAVVLADGTFSATVTLPTSLANGVHHLVATGVDGNGNVRNLVVEVTVSGGTAVLASTGFSTLPYLGTGALALLAGGGLLVAARRRNAA